MQSSIRTDGGQRDTLITENVIFRCVSQGMQIKLNNRAINNVIADIRPHRKLPAVSCLTLIHVTGSLHMGELQTGRRGDGPKTKVELFSLHNKNTEPAHETLTCRGDIPPGMSVLRFPTHTTWRWRGHA